MSKPLVMRSGALPEHLDRLPAHAVVTMEEPWALVAGGLARPPAAVIFNRDTDAGHLEDLAARRPPGVAHVVGLGGGTACDSAKFLAWRWGVPVTIAPTTLSVDAWLCRSVAVRVDGRVRYVGDVAAEALVVDWDVVRRAPPALNRAGVADVLSICTALGDWTIARDEHGAPYDATVFGQARAIAERMLAAAPAVRAMGEPGLAAILRGQLDEVLLCEGWGNARPEEGGEHFLAYCLEEITRGHYVHGQLVALGILVGLRLQRDRGQWPVDRLRAYFDDIGLPWSPAAQGIERRDLARALAETPSYVARERLMPGFWSRREPFEPHGDLSIEGILAWVYG